MPKSQRNRIANLADVAEKAKAFNLRIQDIVVVPVTREFLEAPPEHSVTKK